MNLNDFNYDLPESYIAQTPIEPRDASRLMILDRQSRHIQHRRFRDILELIHPGDVLVMNTTRVLPARLRGHKTGTGGAVEILLLRKLDDLRWRALVGGKRIRSGTRIAFEGETLQATVIEAPGGPERILEFSQPVEPLLLRQGETPLPPYIRAPLDDPERYQTVYSKHTGSAAAPTAGLHFTPELLLALTRRGVHLAECTLHVGLDTFQPVRVQEIKDHRIHREWASLPADSAELINRAKQAGGRIIAVGTTSVRTLETAAILGAGGDPAHPGDPDGVCASPHPVIAFEGDTALFIHPGYRWRVVDAIITNFHLPKSTLLMLVSAFAGREFVLEAYETAKREHYRFFSFGDAMFIT